MRKVIPYIASQFRKDKIWLRRTKKSKRDYQIVLAVDDSSSMADNHSKQVSRCFPVRTRCRFDVFTTSITLKRRHMDVKTTSYGRQNNVVCVLGSNNTLFRTFSVLTHGKEREMEMVKFICDLLDRVLARLSQCVWTVTPRGTVDQGLKLKTTHLILSWLG